jgi:hypothetical protein
VWLHPLQPLPGGGHPPPQQVYAFLSTSVRRIHENVAIAVLDPEVAPVDYPHVTKAIYDFLVNTLWLRGVSVAPSGLVVVSFASAPDCQSAMGFPHRMESYWLSFISHEGLFE